MAQTVRNLPAMQETLGSIPGSGRSPEGNGNALQYSALRIPWTEEPGSLQSMGLQSQTQLWCAAAHGVTKCLTELSD